MSSATLVYRMNFPVTKKVTRKAVKSDLASIWDKAPKPFGLSPPSSPIAKPQKDILSLLSLNVSKTPKKVLLCPPVLKTEKVKKQKIVVPDALYSNISFTANTAPEISEEFLSRITFAYKGDENQIIAWNSFKKVYKTAKQSVVAGPNVSFHFVDGKVYGKALTSSAQKKLEALSSNLPLVDEEKAIRFIDDIAKAEKLSIFSSACFSYGVVTPIIKKESEMGSRTGNLKRVTFVGYMFPDFCESLEKIYKDYDAKKYTVVMY